MKKFQLLGKSLSKAEQKNVKGGEGECYEEYQYGCCLSTIDCLPGNECCPGLKCEVNASGSGTICVKA